MQRQINLVDIMLNNFKTCGHIVTCHSAYLHEMLADIAKEEWKVNIVDISQANRNGVNTSGFENAKKVSSYESLA